MEGARLHRPPVHLVLVLAAVVTTVCYVLLQLPRDQWRDIESIHNFTVAISAAKPLSTEQFRTALELLDPELLSRAPASFLPQYKSPCWNEPGHQQLRCFPQAFILGSFHAGCQGLQAKLSVHPHIVLNKLSISHYWSEDKVSLQQYLDFAGEAVPRVQQYPNDTVIVDGSQSNFAFYWSEDVHSHREFRRVMTPCWLNCSRFYTDHKAAEACVETTCFEKASSADRFMAQSAGVDYDLMHVPLLLRGAYGSYTPKFVVLLRNPVERLLSAFNRYPHYRQRYGSTANSLRRYVKDQVAAFRRCSAKHGTIDCVLYFETHGMQEDNVFFHADQLLRGMYSVYVEVWLHYFPRESFLFIKSEDFFTKTNETLKAVLDHLGLEQPSERLWANMVKGYVPPRLPFSAKIRRSSAALRTLDAFYRPFNQRLAELLGPNFTWPSHTSMELPQDLYRPSYMRQGMRQGNS